MKSEFSSSPVFFEQLNTHQDPLGNLEVDCEEVILVWTQVWIGEKVP